MSPKWRSNSLYPFRAGTGEIFSFSGEGTTMSDGVDDSVRLMWTIGGICVCGDS
jgi:hypothetical protein